MLVAIPFFGRLVFGGTEMQADANDANDANDDT